MVKSPLVPVLIEGSATAITRGWAQLIDMKPGELSLDPDDPENKVTFEQGKLELIGHGKMHFQEFQFRWFCRTIIPEEKYPDVDKEGYPIYDPGKAQYVRSPEDKPVVFSPPPGCFGKGAGPLKLLSGELKLNTRFSLFS